jgi:hypothetical protein
VSEDESRDLTDADLEAVAAGKGGTWEMSEARQRLKAIRDRATERAVKRQTVVAK